MSASLSPEEGVPLFEDSNQEAKSGKRKRTEDEAGEGQSKKKKRTKKPKDVVDDALDSELGVNHAIAHMDSRLLADHIAQRTRRFQPEASTIEVDELSISENAIKDTSVSTLSRATESLPEYLEQYAAPRRVKEKGKKGARTLSDAPKEHGTPHTLVVAGAGLRAADLTRALRRFQTKDSMVAKLFAKHIKLKEAVEMAKKTRMGIGVGTPQRIMDLLDDGALSAKHLERIVIDASHIDQKKRGVMDMKETHLPLVQLLTRPDLEERYGDGERKIELLFF